MKLLKQASLSVLTGSLEGESIQLLENKRLTVGRERTADICLPEKKISRHHATIVWNSDSSSVLIEDQGSLNGCYVNGVKIGKTAELHHGDRLQMGPYLMELRMNTASSEVLEAVSENSLTDVHPTDGLAMPEEFLRGRLDKISLADLLQMLSSAQKTGRLFISQNEFSSPPPPSQDELTSCGSVYLKNGEVLSVRTGSLINEEAFYHFIHMKGGHFGFFSHSDFTFRAPMSTSVEGMILDAYRRLDEEKFHQQINLKADDELQANLDEPLTSLNEDELRVFQLAWKQKRVKTIIKNSPLDEEETTRILRTLIERAFLKRA